MAEYFQAEPVAQGHVADYVNSGAYLNHDPERLGKDLWGHMNLAISDSSGGRNAFDNAPPGNGFDAQRRIGDPMGPRSEERLFKMHEDIINPKPADSLASVLHTIEDWEGEIQEHYRCGGTHWRRRPR